MTAPTCGALFSGIAGIELGLERAGWQTIWNSEIDPYASSILAGRWPHVPNLGDITKVDWDAVERPDLICGGFPCQDLSIAGKRAGLQGQHSGLWTEFTRAVRQLRPQFVLVENVTAVTARGLDRIVADLADSGYDTEWDCVPAAAVGAPHLRARLFILAYPVGFRDRQPYETVFAGRHPALVSDWWAREPDVVRVAPRVPGDVDRLRVLGNAVVPQVAEWIGSRLLDAMSEVSV